MYPANRSLNRMNRLALYRLKRDYGGSLTVYKLTGADTDVQTGVKTITKTAHAVKRAVVLPATVDRDFVKTISQISSNKKFVMGGDFDTSAKHFILEVRDLPAGFELTHDDWIVYGNLRYDPVKIQQYEFDAALIVTAKAVLGHRPEQIFDLSADSFLAASGSTDHE